MPSSPSTQASALLRFNRQLLQQAAELAQAHALPGRPSYRVLAGPHLRHVIEHYEALLFPPQPGVVDYDARARDEQLEASPQRAQARLEALYQALEGCAVFTLAEPLRVLGQCGLMGEDRFEASSSLGRELAFVASHAIHHFALLVGYCQQHGVPIPDGFGRAPATRAHERARQTPAFA